MTRPRKEQIRDQKAKYTRINTVGALTSFGWDNSQSNSGVYIQDLLDSSGGQYTDFVNASVTKVTGGADASCQAVLYGGNGPFTVVNGQQFTITMTAIGTVTVTINSSDLVSLGGFTVLTTSRAAKLINTRLATFGITYPAARNQDGQLVIYSANTTGLEVGPDAFVTLTDVTSGTLAALGFESSPASASGRLGSTRGIVTSSPDGLGGVAYLKNLNGSSAYVPVRILYHVGNWRYVEDAPAAQPAFARVRELPVGPSSPGTRKIRLNYYRKGVIPARILTNGGSVSTLAGTDIFTVTVAGPDTGTQVLTVPFTSTPTTIVDTIATFNNAWAAQTLASGNVEATRATVICSSGPYSFSGTETMVISFNSTAQITVTPAATDFTPTDLAATINAAIATAGLTAQGEARVIGLSPQGSLEIRSKSVDPLVSRLVISAGSGTPPDLRVLKQLNLSPGTYAGSHVAKAYGADEIRFSNPGRGLGNGLTIASNPLSMGRLGLTGSSVTTAATLGDEEVGPPAVQSLVAEVMDFGEVPDDYEQHIAEFNTVSAPQIMPENGMANSAFSPLFDPTGVLKEMAGHLHFLNTDQQTLGSRLTNSSAEQLKPRSITGYLSTVSGILLSESVDLTDIQYKTRTYVLNGSLIMTANAVLGTAGTWTKDINGVRSTKLVVGTNPGFYYRPDASTGAWADNAWEIGLREISAATIQLDDGGYPDGTIVLGGSGPSTIDLINPATCRGREVWIISKAGNVASLVPFGSEKINNVAGTFGLSIPGGKWRLTCDGTDWYVYEDATTANAFTTIAINNLNRLRTLTSAATINTPAKDATIIVNPSSSFNLTLPAPSGCTGQKIFLLNGTGTMSSTNTVTLVRSGGEKINNYAGSFILEAPYGRWWLVSDGTDWHVAQV